MSSDTPRPGLFDSARALMGALLEVGQTRLQLASTELEEERVRLAQLLLLATVALFFLGIGLVLAALLVVVLAWDGPREWALAGMTLLYLGIGAATAWVWRRRRRAKPPLLSATLQELRADQAALRHGAAPREPA